MAKNVYRTAQGQLVDIDNLKLVNEGVVAVGNMNVNARGDRINSDGTIIETRNQVMKKRYNSGVTVVSDDSSPIAPKPSASPAPSQVRETAQQVQQVSAPTETTIVNNNLRGNLASQIASPTVIDASGLNELSIPVTTLKRI